MRQAGTPDFPTPAETLRFLLPLGKVGRRSGQTPKVSADMRLVGLCVAARF